MILNDDDILARLESPDNLMNRLKGISGIPAVPAVVEDSDTANYVNDIAPPTVDELIDNLEGRLTQGKIVQSGLAVLESAMQQLQVRIFDAEKPEKLSRIATDVSRVIDSFRTKKQESANAAPVIVWKPMMINENRYESVIAHD